MNFPGGGTMNHDSIRGATVRAVRGVLLAISAASMLSVSAHAVDTSNLAAMPEARVQQLRGVDQRVDYAGLTKYGKWDDLNYQVTKEDLAYLS